VANPIQTSLEFREIISRKEAIRSGLKRYFTGKPCKRGHIAERFVSGQRCLGCAQEWRKANAERLADIQSAWRARNPDKVRELQRAWKAANAQRVAEHAKRCYDKRAKSPKRLKIYRQNWLASHRKKLVAKAGRPKPDCCEVCGRTAKHICYDHCHVSQEFRGWLCNKCNLALGYVDDSPEILLSLIEYLKGNRENATEAGIQSGDGI
jgi:hypothetical protein